MTFSKISKGIVLTAIVLLAGCTSDKTKIADKITESVQQKMAEDAKADVQGLNSEWLKQGYQDYLVKNIQVQITDIKIQDDTAVVEYKTEKVQSKIRIMLVGVIGKVSPNGERNFNFTDGASMVQKQLGLSEGKYWGPVETANLRKGPQGWQVVD